MPRSVLAACGLFIAVMGAATAIYLNESKPASTPCEWVDHGRFAQPCAISEVWDGLAQQAKHAPPVTARNANIAVTRGAITQARQLWETGFVPAGRAVAPWPFQLPLDWNVDPFRDRNWRYQLHAWRMLDLFSVPGSKLAMPGIWMTRCASYSIGTNSIRFATRKVITSGTTWRSASEQ